MSSKKKLQVRRRAGFRCEYCLIPEEADALPCHVDHIIAKQHAGKSSLDNLALACSHCNLRKGTNLNGIDLRLGRSVRLFNCRTDDWAQHFKWNGASFIGLTSIGRATVATLGINELSNVAVRAVLMSEGWYGDVT